MNDNRMCLCKMNLQCFQKICQHQTNYIIICIKHLIYTPVQSHKWTSVIYKAHSEDIYPREKRQTSYRQMGKPLTQTKLFTSCFYLQASQSGAKWLPVDLVWTLYFPPEGPRMQASASLQPTQLWRHIVCSVQHQLWRSFLLLFIFDAHFIKLNNHNRVIEKCESMLKFLLQLIPKSPLELIWSFLDACLFQMLFWLCSASLISVRQLSWVCTE